LGLGNPGENYARTRHNVGFLTMDAMAGKLDIKFKCPFFKRYMIARGRFNGTDIFLVKPLTYMNRSGEILNDVLHYTGTALSDLTVVLDTLDLSVGEVKFKLKGSSAGHKGLGSILRIARTEEITRCSIGIGRPSGYNEVVDYVLDRPSREEEDILDSAIHRVRDQLLLLCEKSPQSVMNIMNGK
jgi:peptidyl-tRNA hydrolase, PTH1 family